MNARSVAMYGCASGAAAAGSNCLALRSAHFYTICCTFSLLRSRCAVSHTDSATHCYCRRFRQHLVAYIILVVAACFCFRLIARHIYCCFLACVWPCWPLRRMFIFLLATSATRQPTMQRRVSASMSLSRPVSKSAKCFHTQKATAGISPSTSWAIDRWQLIYAL